MNKAYRIIWNQARKCLMVVGENVKSSGKTSGGKKAIVDAVAMAVLALGGTAYSQTQTVSGVEVGPYSILDGYSLLVTPSGVITNPSSTAVFASGSVVGEINNQGSIGGGGGIEINSGKRVLSGITNDGTIAGVGNAIVIWTGSTISNGITNSGYISSVVSAGILVSDISTVVGGVINNGQIRADSSGVEVFGRSLIDGGITNTVGGLISAEAGSGIRVRNASSVDFIHNNGGTISGGEAGVDVNSLSTITGGIANTGSIGGGQIGIRVRSSSTIIGGITNAIGGYINGLDTGFKILSSTIVGGVTNSGTIIGGTFGGFILGSDIDDLGSSVSGGINNQGLISAGLNYDGVYLRWSTVSGGITNSGTITGAYHPTGPYSSGSGIHIASSSVIGGISNSGLISGGVSGVRVNGNFASVDFISNIGGTISGVQVGVEIDALSTITGGVINSGSIGGGQFGIKVQNSSAINGGITNTIGGTITGLMGQGIVITANSNVDFISNVGGYINGIANAGTVSAGISLTSFALVDGGINNSGTIASGNAINLANSSLTGGITNTGYLQAGTFGISLAASQLVGGITNSGTINATQGIVLDNSTISGGDISNQGAILGANAAVNLHAQSTVVNIQNSGTFTGVNAIYIESSTVSGIIENQGSITGFSDGINIGSNSSVNKISNIGGIISGVRAIELSNSTILDGITNSGSMGGSTYGIVVNNSNIFGGITNNIGGEITGALGQGIVINSYSNIDFISNVGGYINGINNAGTISGAPIGISLSSFALLDGGINNSGSVSGESGIVISGSILFDGINNSGTVTASPTAVFGNNGLVMENSSISGGITNSGLIQAGWVGLAVFGNSDIYDGIDNSGTISGFAALAISQAEVSGGITNSGLLDGGVVGLSLAGATHTGGINNSGKIVNALDFSPIPLPPAAIVIFSSTVSGGITNTGLIASNNGNAIIIDASGSDGTGAPIDIINTNTGSQVGTIIGAIYGNANVTNSGLWALQSYSTATGDVAMGSINTSSIAGNYSQSSQGTLQFGVTNSGASTAYSTLNVDGTATFDNGATLKVMVGTPGIVGAGSIGGEIYAAGGVSNPGTFNVIDNSVLWDFNPVITGIGSTTLDLIAAASSDTCYGTVTGAVAGPCLVGFDSPSLQVATTGSISGDAIGIQVLTGLSDGANTLTGGAGYGINNLGTVIGSQNGISFTPGATLTGGITNSGSIGSDFKGISLNQSAVVDGIINIGIISGGNTAIAVITNSTIAGGITNSGSIIGANFGISINTNSSVAGGITNALGGLIAASSLTGKAISIDGSSAVDFVSNNGGTISGDAGIWLGFNGVVANGVTNGGLISGNAGVVLSTFSTISGGLVNTGLISGSSVGGLLIDFGSIVDFVSNNGGTISGDAGIRLGFAGSISGGVTNSGLISGNTGIGLGIFSAISGGLVNTGLINGSVSGLLIDSTAVVDFVANNGGTISGYTGISLYANGAISGGVTNSGFIGGNAGIGIVLADSSNISGGIVNSGSISGDGDGIVALVYSTITGGITNSVSGLIAGASLSGIFIGQNSSLDFIANNGGTISGGVMGVALTAYSSISNGITNAGSIGGGLNGIQIQNTSSIAGGITNTAGGLIAGASSSGIFIGQNSTLDFIANNGGTISGKDVGIYLVSNSSIGDGITNSGFISGDKGIELSSSSVVGGITNAVGGTIAGLSGQGIAVGVNSNVDYISNIGGYINSINNAGVISGGITNTGLIASNNGNAIIIDSSGSDGTGAPISIINTNNGSQVGTIIGAINANANVTNSGLWALQSYSTVTGAAAVGSINASNISGNYRQSSQGTLQFGVTNSGASTAYSTLNVDGTATFDNGATLKVLIAGPSIVGAGSIGGQVTAGALSASSLNVIDNSVLWNFNPVISGGGATLELIATASGVCAGTAVSGPTTGPCLVGFDAPSIQILGGTNAGVISGDAIGIQVLTGLSDGANTLTGGAGYGINNLGTVIGSQTGISFTPGATLTGGITNSGLITGGVVGAHVYQSSLSGGLANSGTISGAIGLGLTNALLADGINNSGFISGSSKGISIANGSAVTGGLNNSGEISGSQYAVYVDGLSTLAGGINITGTSAKFVGDVSAPAADMNIKSGAIFTNTNAISVNAFNIENNATFNFIGGSSTSYGSTNSGALSISNGIQVASSVNNAGNLNVGTYAPTITGNYVQSSAGTFSSSISSNTNYGRLNVTGSASLAGTAAVTVLNPATILAGGSSTLAGVISAGTLSGKFDRIDTAQSLLYTFTPVYTGNQFDLAINVAPTPTPTPNSNIFAQIVMANNNPAALGAANVLDGFLNNPTTNPGMAPVLDRLSVISGTSGGAGVSNAISQTLPALVGAGSLIASQVQQGLNQIMQGRQNQLRGLSSGEEYIGNRNAWMKGYGSWANQDSHNNVSGYRVNTGGLAIGVDNQLSPQANLGAVFAFGNSSVNGNNAAAASGMTVNSYQLGAYGDYAVRPDIHVNYQANFGLNNNKEYRNLSAFNGVQGVASGSGGVNANANYNSYIGHLGTGVRKLVPLTENTTFIPAFRVDYTTVQSQGYTETGAGTLNLGANSQTYNALLTSADLRIDHMLVNSLKLSANIGAGYNTLNNQVQMTAAYQGGGPAFTTNGLQISPWIYNAGLGVSGRVTKDVEMNVRYDSQLSTTGYNNQLVSAKIKFFY